MENVALRGTVFVVSVSTGAKLSLAKSTTDRDEAIAWRDGFNRMNSDGAAVAEVHPITAAISIARPKLVSA